MVYLYRTLDVDKVIATVQKLSARINDRFPNAGLNSVCAELEAIATETKHRIEWISKPNWIIRGAVGLVLVLMISVLIFTIFSLELQAAKFGIGDLVQVMEATINDFILIGAAIFFMVNLEGRIKRQRSLKVLHELRSIVHVIDMHQLTKDPSRQTENNTTNSPKIELSHSIEWGGAIAAAARSSAEKPALMRPPRQRTPHDDDGGGAAAPPPSSAVVDQAAMLCSVLILATWWIMRP